jgi:transcriptional regulator with XRE-family HTH domain
MLDEQAVRKIVTDVEKYIILMPERKAFKAQIVFQFFLHGGSFNNYVTNPKKGLLFRRVSAILKYFLRKTTILEAKAMQQNQYPVIDPVATGENIVRLRQERGLSVRDLQAFFGFEEPQAIYKWQRGKSLPSVDNLYALGALLDVPMDEILVSARPQLNMIVLEQQADACCSAIYIDRLFWIRQKSEIASTIYSSAWA